MATQRPANRTGGSNSGYGNPVSSGAGNTVGSPDSIFRTLQLLARVLIYVAIIVFVTLSFLANIETKWMKAEIKSEARELRKLRRDVEDLLEKGKNEKAVVPKPGIAGADGL